MSTGAPTRFKPTPHPVLALPSLAEAMAMGSAKWSEAMVRREEIIAKERKDQFTHGWEPPIWKVCDALLGFPWVDPEWAESLRQSLGFPAPVSTLLALGGNRASKSQWASKACMRTLRLGKEKRCWALHSKLEMSRDYQQPLFYLYLPTELKGKDIKSATTYIAFKRKTGFTEEKFILPNLSETVFKSYDQDVNSIEGGELDIIWPDELVPRDWLETLELRIATRSGKMPVTFTPVNGYSDTVALFLDGAVPVLETTAYLCPKDGGAPDVPRALGLEPAEYEELLLAEKEKRAALCPQSRPESFRTGTDGVESGRSGSSALPDGRVFEEVPRIMRCADPKRAVVFFHSSDNPYGNPKEVWATIRGKSQDFIKERFYGIAKKLVSACFSTFNDKVHVIKPEQIPAEGTNYQLTDPHGLGRNYFMLWIRSTPEHDYVYREWPGNYWIPGVGVPGPWALPGNKTHPDGTKGPAQSGFGWGHWKYKQEIARVEKWVLPDGRSPDDPCPAGMTERDWVISWDEHRPRKEMVLERYIDSRFASVPKEENDRPVTLLQELANIGLNYKPTPGDTVSEGVRDIENALHYDQDKPIDFFNKPRLLISADCLNTIFALRIWTGLEKDRGATTEPIGLLRYFYRAGCSYIGGEKDEGEEEEESNTWSSVAGGQRKGKYY